jgi:hypothetical protein
LLAVPCSSFRISAFPHFRTIVASLLLNILGCRRRSLQVLRTCRIFGAFSLAHGIDSV